MKEHDMFPSATTAPLPEEPASDERRQWIRLDDRLLLEYRLLGESADQPVPGCEPVTQDIIAAAVGKPTEELLARSGEALANSSLLPWMMKVDWLLDVILKTLEKAHPGCVDIARLTNVTISGGGISFVSPRRFDDGDRLALKIFLPPFTPICTVARVVRSLPDPQGEGFALAMEFVDLSVDDQEHIIRHIFHVQAARLRARR
jgi:hypothetical protein